MTQLFDLKVIYLDDRQIVNRFKTKVKLSSEAVVKTDGHSFGVPQTEQWLRNDTQKMQNPMSFQQL